MAASQTDLEGWAASRQLTLRRVRDAEGFVLEGSTGALGWRAEWGASQRSYIEGPELRLFCELGLHRDVQLLVLNRHLVEAMEKTVFEQFVEGVQTRIDTETPQEMRWLVMFPKLSGAELKDLRERYVALCSQKTWLLHWLNGPMSLSLMACAELVAPQVPVVWTIGRGRLTLRTAMPQVQLEALAGWLAAFETGIREARRAAVEMHDSQMGGLTTLPAAWSRNGPRDGGPTTL